MSRRHETSQVDLAGGEVLASVAIGSGGEGGETTRAVRGPRVIIGGAPLHGREERMSSGAGNQATRTEASPATTAGPPRLARSVQIGRRSVTGRSPVSGHWIVPAPRPDTTGHRRRSRTGGVRESGPIGHSTKPPVKSEIQPSSADALVEREGRWTRPIAAGPSVASCDRPACDRGRSRTGPPAAGKDLGA